MENEYCPNQRYLEMIQNKNDTNGIYDEIIVTFLVSLAQSRSRIGYKEQVEFW